MRCAVFALLVAATPALATSIVTLDEAGLRAAADIIVEGEVAATETRIVGRRIITFVTLVSGAAPTLTTTLVAVPGGVVDGIVQLVPGAPVLHVGARYRLFLGAASGPRLDDRGPRARGVVGFHRGAFLLVEGAAGVIAVPLTERGEPDSRVVR
jgi:hypothetical protein